MAVNVLIGQHNVRLTSGHGDDCLTLWPNMLVYNFSAPCICTLYIELHKNDLK